MNAHRCVGKTDLLRTASDRRAANLALNAALRPRDIVTAKGLCRLALHTLNAAPVQLDANVALEPTFIRERKVAFRRERELRR